MLKHGSVVVPAVAGPSALARVFHVLEGARDANAASGVKDRRARAAKVGCVAIALTAVSLFGIAEVPTPIRLGAPVIGLSLAMPLVLTLWLPAISPRRARLLAQLAALALTVVGSASFARATAWQVVIAYFVPALLLLRANDEIAD